MAKKAKVLKPEQIFDAPQLRAHKLESNPVHKQPRHLSIPPIRTLPLVMQMELTADMPESIIEALGAYKPSSRLRQYGIPSKVILSSERLEELCLISSYLISETTNASNNFLELYIDFKQMFFWAMAMVFKPNNPYLAIVTSEENSTAALTFSAYLANYYITLADKSSNEMMFKWYRSLEFVDYKKSEEASGVIVIQCRWPSWVDNKEKLLRNILNIRAAYENATVLLIMQEEDLRIAPYLLNDEPFGVFLKIGRKSDIDKEYRRLSSSPINKIMRRIQKNMK
jgi:hypothetical protein